MGQSFKYLTSCGLTSIDTSKKENFISKTLHYSCMTTINKILAFLQEKLSNLAATYSTSNLSQLRCLLGSIFMLGFNWGYPGCSNSEISPIYQVILDSDKGDVNVGCGAWSKLEPL